MEESSHASSDIKTADFDSGGKNTRSLESIHILKDYD